MRFHVPSLPHTSVVQAADWCAYTAKVRRFANFMTDAGHEVVVYAGVGADHRGEHVAVVSPQEQYYWFHEDPDWTLSKKEWWDPNSEWWTTFNVRCIAAIGARIQPGDFVLAIAGRCQQLLQPAFPYHSVVEWGVGYEGVFADFRVWESYAWMHHVLGIRREADGRGNDTVIPNTFDPAELDFRSEPDDYFLYMGRVAQRKGVALAVEACRRLGERLIVAGPCVRAYGEGRIVADELTLEYDRLEYAGVLTGDDKAKMLSGARALFVPTRYVEPFGGVAVEAMMSGTPVIASDWGAFTETVQRGVTGFRCRSADEILQAAKKVDGLNRDAIAEIARDRFSTARGAELYGQYFRSLQGGA